MSHSLYWMQERLIERSFGNQIRETKRAEDAAMLRINENSDKLKHAQAQLQFIESTESLNNQIFEATLRVDTIQSAATGYRGGKLDNMGCVQY